MGDLYRFITFSLPHYDPHHIIIQNFEREHDHKSWILRVYPIVDRPTSLFKKFERGTGFQMGWNSKISNQHLNFAFCDPHRLMLGVCWAHLGSMLGRVGPMLGHPGPMLYPHWWKSNQQIVNPHVFFEGCGLPFSVRHFCHVSKWRGPDIGEQRCGLVSVMKCTI